MLQFRNKCGGEAKKCYSLKRDTQRNELPSSQFLDGEDERGCVHPLVVGGPRNLKSRSGPKSSAVPDPCSGCIQPELDPDR